jgi:hypothetical protein
MKSIQTLLTWSIAVHLNHIKKGLHAWVDEAGNLYLSCVLLPWPGLEAGRAKQSPVLSSYHTYYTMQARQSASLQRIKKRNQRRRIKLLYFVGGSSGPTPAIINK